MLDLPLHCLLQCMFACILLPQEDDRPPCYLIKGLNFITKEQGTRQLHTLCISSLKSQSKVIHTIKLLYLAPSPLEAVYYDRH